MNELEQIYRKHASAVYRFAWGLCGNRACAEDLVSETFVRLLTRAPRIRTQTALGYLLAVARNTYLTGRRRQQREVALTDDIEAAQLDPGDRLDDQARLEVVMGALSGLPEGERAALLLRVDHDLSYEEIAQITGLPIGTVKSRIHRGRSVLATRLARILK